MGRGKTILICGGAGILSTSIQMHLERLGGVGEVDVITPDQAKERGISINEPNTLAYRVQEIISEKIITNDSLTQFTPPISRRERRAQNRKKR